MVFLRVVALGRQTFGRQEQSDDHSIRRPNIRPYLHLWSRALPSVSIHAKPLCITHLCNQPLQDLG